MNKNYIIFGIVLLLTAGCASPRLDTMSKPGPGAPGNQAIVPGTEQDAAVADPTGTLTLQQALSLALQHNPEFEAKAWDVRIAEAQALQAGAWRNPQVEFEVEEFDKDGAGFESSEVSIKFKTKVRLGGKRKRKKAAADANTSVANREYESGRLDMISATTRNFMAVVAAQEHLTLVEATVELAGKASQAVAAKVRAGKEPPFQAAKASAELELARVDTLEARNSLDAARVRLASLWGSDTAVFDEAEGGLELTLKKLPELDDLHPLLLKNPALACCDADVLLAEAALSMEEAARVPNIVTAVGIHQSQEDDSESLSFSIGIPLPVFDRNNGNITAARHQIKKAEAERRTTGLELTSNLAESHASLTAATKRAAALQSKVVPAMESAFESAHEGYKQGKFSFLDMLDAQRGLYQAKDALVEALLECHSKIIEIERIIGTRLSEVATEEE